MKKKAKSNKFVLMAIFIFIVVIVASLATTVAVAATNVVSTYDYNVTKNIIRSKNTTYSDTYEYDNSLFRDDGYILITAARTGVRKINMSYHSNMNTDGKIRVYMRNANNLFHDYSESWITNNSASASINNTNIFAIPILFSHFLVDITEVDLYDDGVMLPIQFVVVYTE